MHFEDRQRTEVFRDPAALPGDAVLAPVLMRLLARGAERSEIVRALLAYACHGDGLGLAEVEVYAYARANARLEGYASHVATAAGSLEVALDRDAASLDSEDQLEREARLRQTHVDPEADGSLAARAWAAFEVVHAAAEGHDAGGLLACAVPLRIGLTPWGVLVARARAAPAESRLEAFAARWAQALESVARMQQARRKGEQIEAMLEMSRAAISAMNVAEALHLAARLAVRTAGARGAALWRMHEHGLQLDVTHGPAGRREARARALAERAERVGATCERIVVSEEDAAHEGQEGAAALVPIVAFERLFGVIAVFDPVAFERAGPLEFTSEAIDTVQGLADQLALMLDLADRYQALRVAERRSEDLRSWVRHEERLASLGEHAVRAAGDARAPIASIGAFARRVHREVDENHPHREYLEIVIREAERLERLLGNASAAPPAGPARLERVQPNALMQEALSEAGEALVRRRIRLLKRLSPDVPELLLDPTRMRQVVSNLLGGALAHTPLGSRIRVESRVQAGQVVIEIAHDGPRPPGGLLEAMLGSFAGTQDGPPELGLGTARQLVREHGGELRVRGDAEWSVVMGLTLPVQENGDRRAQALDRRQARPDRRGRYRVP